jgi:hypothetical protein
VKTKDDYTINLPLQLVPLLRDFLKQKGFWYEGPKSLGKHRFTFLISDQLVLEKVIHYLRSLDGPYEPNQEYQIIIFQAETEIIRITLKHHRPT